jgi:hypothetical protein
LNGQQLFDGLNSYHRCKVVTLHKFQQNFRIASEKHGIAKQYSLEKKTNGSITIDLGYLINQGPHVHDLLQLLCNSIILMMFFLRIACKALQVTSDTWREVP